MNNARHGLDTPVGPLTVEASSEGLVELSWRRSTRRSGDPRAEKVLAGTLTWLSAYFVGEDPGPPPPLDPRGTPFQRAVWRRLLAIPRGATATYGEIARALGKPGGARAVGQANGRNPLAIIVPCHRVIAGGGRLGGYSAGLRRKRWLLTHEGIAWNGKARRPTRTIFAG